MRLILLVIVVALIGCSTPTVARVQRRAALRAKLAIDSPRRIVIGASGIYDPGWIPTDITEFDLLKPDDWQTYIEPNSVDAFLAEHVWEHLSLEDGRIAAQTCYRYLKPGGYLRIAVPDGNFPDAAFQEYIKVGGVGGGGTDGGHLIVYTADVLADSLTRAGFSTRLLEYHDAQGRFHGQPWDAAGGIIHRSAAYDARGPISIIIDAIKLH